MVGYKILFVTMLIVIVVTLIIFISLVTIISKRKKLIDFESFSVTEYNLFKKKNFAIRKSINPILMDTSTFFIVQQLDKKFVANKMLQYDLKNFTIFNVKGKMYEIS